MYWLAARKNEVHRFGMHQEPKMKTVTISQISYKHYHKISSHCSLIYLVIKSTTHTPPHQQHPPQTSNHLVRFANAIPKLYNPNAASTLSPTGRPFCVLMALGMDDPARTTLASKAASTPYEARFCRR